MRKKIVNPRISNEMLLKMYKEKKRKIEIYSFFPVDKHDCECQAQIADLKIQLARLPEDKRESLMKKIGPQRCPKSRKPGYNRYKIVCAQCGQTVAFVYAKDKYLTDWCDLHYYNWCDRKRWYGCATVNISPIDGKLGFECFCGNDTRDFRNSATLPPKEIEARLKKRDFGKPNSGFIVKRVRRV